MSLEDIHAWKPRDNGIVFQITRESGFSLFAEGVAIGKVHELSNSGVDLRVRTTFAVSSDTPFKPAEQIPRLGLLATAFGLALISKATSVRDANDREVRDTLLGTLWGLVQNSGGILASGAKQYLLFRDPDYSIPHCLRESERNNFPLLGKFRSLLARLGTEITHRKGLGASRAESQLLTFLYEAALNSHEHARGFNGAPLNGIRGLIVQKSLYPRWSGLDDRPQMPDLVRAYIRRVWHDTEGDLMFTAYTIADLGPGIHRTLPSGANESDWQRLNRALRAGESRKARGSGLSVGQGFTKILTAAKELKAFVFLRSAEMSGFKDFSTGTERVDSPLAQYAESMHGDVGSSITLLWPLSQISPDQQTLFPVELESVG